MAALAGHCYDDRPMMRLMRSAASPLVRPSRTRMRCAVSQRYLLSRGRELAPLGVLAGKPPTPKAGGKYPDQRVSASRGNTRQQKIRCYTAHYG